MNKLKGSSSAVKMKYLLFVFAAAVLVSLPTRVYQLLALVDTTNGFFKESDVTIPVLYGVIVVFGLLFLVLSFVSKEVPSPKLPTGKNPVLGIASFVMVAGLGIDMFKILMDILPANQGGAEVFVALLKSNLEQNGGFFIILHFVFAFFSIIYFLVFAISHLNGKASYKEFKILALSPLCWAMTNLVKNLMNAISFIKVSELLFEIFMFVFVMLFFLTFARISSGVFTEDSMWGIYGYGLSASLLASVVTIPRIVIMLVGLDAVEGNEFNVVHFTTMAFILAYIFASLGVGFKEGLRARREVSEIELPEDDAVITKKDDYNDFFAEEDEEEEAVVLSEPITEEPVIEEPIIEEPVIEEPVIEEPVIEEPIIEEPVIEEPVIEEPIIEEPVIEEPVIGESVIEEPVIEEPVIEEPVIEEPVVEEPVVEEIAEEAEKTAEPKKSVPYETLEISENMPVEKIEKRKSKLFKKKPKTKKMPSRSDAGDSELTTVSLADLKNKNKE